MAIRIMYLRSTVESDLPYHALPYLTYYVLSSSRSDNDASLPRVLCLYIIRT